MVGMVAELRRGDQLGGYLSSGGRDVQGLDGSNP